jgi:hypothetical protein
LQHERSVGAALFGRAGGGSSDQSKSRFSNRTSRFSSGLSGGRRPTSAPPAVYTSYTSEATTVADRLDYSYPRKAGLDSAARGGRSSADVSPGADAVEGSSRAATTGHGAPSALL